MQTGRETNSSPQPPPVAGIQIQAGPASASGQAANSTALSADLSSLLYVFDSKLFDFCREEGRKTLMV